MEEEPKQVSLIERYRESHHAVARMFAANCTPSMIRQQTGYSQRRLTLLWNDPTFQELIAVYRARIEDKWNANVDAYADLAMGNMIAAERMLADKLANADDKGEFLATNELIKIASDRADRFGYSKHVTHEHKHDFAAMLDRAIARSGKSAEIARSEPKLIEGQVVDAPTPTSAAVPQGVVVRGAEAVSLAAQPPRSFVAVLNPIKRRKVA